MSGKNESIKNILSKLDDSKSNQIIFLSVITILALIIRLYNFPLDVPFFNDSQSYFWYAIDTSILNEFPSTHNLPNNGWPVFVSIFFQIIDSNDFLDYQNLQRMIGVIFSVLSIFPVYILCSRFFKKSYSLLGASLFIFEPRLILNSHNGTPESLYVFLIATFLALLLSNNSKKIYFSFLVIGLLTIVRYEGLLLIIPASVMFFMKFRPNVSNILKFCMCIIILSSIVIPVAYLKNESMGKDGIISHISAGPEFYEKSIIEKKSTMNDFIFNGGTGIVKYLGWIQIPFFIFFVPIGFILFLKKIDHRKITIILTILMIFIPAFYAYSREFSETKYLFALFPIFALFSCFVFERIFDRMDKKKIIFYAILICVILSSSIFVTWKSIDYEHYRETYQILKQISENEITINSDFGMSGSEFVYFHWTRLVNVDEFPIEKRFLPEANVSYTVHPARIEKEQNMGKETESVTLWQEKSKINNFQEYLLVLEKQEITHLLIDETNNVSTINDQLRKDLVHVFNNENEFPFLKKVYDSNENGFNYHVKLFKIDYTK